MDMTDRERRLRGRVRLLTWLFMAGLVVSGVTAIPLAAELDLGVRWLGLEEGTDRGGIAGWVVRLRDAVSETVEKHPFMAYGTDWLAFGHFVIAIAFIGALRDPVRNAWLFTFGMIACVLIIPYAVVFGQVRGIPLWWRLADCSFGVLGFVPLWYCSRAVKELESMGGEAR